MKKDVKVWVLILILMSAFCWTAGANVAVDNDNGKSVEQGNVDGSSFNATNVSVTRYFPDITYPGEEFNVSLTQSGFFITGSVTETLPEGFEFRGSFKWW